MARPATKKRQIEEAAIYLFATKGVPATTVKDIAARAGVAVGALYRHYVGKNEMAWELFCRETRSFAAALASVLSQPKAPLRQRVAQGVRALYEGYRLDPARFAFICRVRENFPLETAPGLDGGILAAVTEFVAEAMRRRQIVKGRPELLAAMVMGALRQVLLMHHYGRLSIEPIAAADEVASAVLKLMRPRK